MWKALIFMPNWKRASCQLVTLIYWTPKPNLSSHYCSSFFSLNLTAFLAVTYFIENIYSANAGRSNQNCRYAFLNRDTSFAFKIRHFFFFFFFYLHLFLNGNTRYDGMPNLIWESVIIITTSISILQQQKLIIFSKQAVIPLQVTQLVSLVHNTQ